MSEGSPAVGLFTFLVFILINAVLYGFGAAVNAVNENIIEEKAKEGDAKSKRILKWINNPSGLINSIHTETIILDMAAGAILVPAVSRMVENSLGLGENILVEVMTALVLINILAIFGILVPKKIAAGNSAKFVYKFSGIVNVLLMLVMPATYVITRFSNAAIKVFGIEPYGSEENVTEEEIITMVNEGHEQGVILESDAEMITNIFEFSDKEARDIMTHRKNVKTIDARMTVEDALNFILEGINSRYPVYDRDIDNIIGILHFRDLVEIYSDETRRNQTLMELKDELLMKARFIPETRKINTLIKTMQTEKTHIVIVVDEYGQTSGILTMEDILEEIVGNIMDEHDNEEALIVGMEEDSFIISGIAMLEDIEDVLGIEFDDEDYDTLNGFLTSCIGKLPEKDDLFEIQHEGWSFRVLEVEDRIIKKVEVKRLKSEMETNNE